MFVRVCVCVFVRAVVGLLVSCFFFLQTRTVRLLCCVIDVRVWGGVLYGLHGLGLFVFVFACRVLVFCLWLWSGCIDYLCCFLLFVCPCLRNHLFG